MKREHDKTPAADRRQTMIPLSDPALRDGHRLAEKILEELGTRSGIGRALEVIEDEAPQQFDLFRTELALLCSEGIQMVMNGAEIQRSGYKDLGEYPTDIEAKPVHDWHEERGSVLWWTFPVSEPPWVGDPLCSDWVDGQYTHWTPIPLPARPGESRYVCRCPDCIPPAGESS